MILCLSIADDDRTDSHRRFKLQATQDTLVVKFQWNKIRDTLQNFSKEQLGVLSDVLQKQKTQEDQGEDAEDGVTMETFNDMALEDVWYGEAWFGWNLDRTSTIVFGYALLAEFLSALTHCGLAPNSI